MIEPPEDREPKRRKAPAGQGMAVGVALGAAFDNIAVGIAVGVAIGGLFDWQNRQ